MRTALWKNIDITNLLVDEFNIALETSGGDESWINVKNERKNRSIQNMLR